MLDEYEAAARSPGRDHLWPDTPLAAPATKRSTVRGEGRVKLIAALTKHHAYANGGCLNLEPIGDNQLARLADVRPSTASEFFKKEFKGHVKYRRLCGDAVKLAAAIKLLRGEFAPHALYGTACPVRMIATETKNKCMNTDPPMTPADLQAKLAELMALPAETESVEFKEAKTSFHLDNWATTSPRSVTRPI